MSLINKENLIKDFWESEVEFRPSQIDEVLRLINEQTELNAEEKTGEWVDDKGLYRCSACNHLWSELWWTACCPIDRMYKLMPFCPSCGAKMKPRNS